MVAMFDFTGLTIAIMRGFTDVKYIDYSWTTEKVCFCCNLLCIVVCNIIHKLVVI